MIIMTKFKNDGTTKITMRYRAIYVIFFQVLQNLTSVKKK